MAAKILIASVLKPAGDPRSYEKMAKTLAKAGHEVHVCGPLPYPTKKDSRIQVHLTGPYPKGNWQRFLYPTKIRKIIRQVRPQLLIINTHELLLIALWYKLVIGGKIIYDIRENYFRNLWYQHNHPAGMRHLMAAAIRLKEYFTARMIDHFILAEKCYAAELSFSGKRHTIIENKALPRSAPPAPTPSDKITFLLSGTIGREYGVFSAIEFYRHWPATDYELLIAGHCPNAKVRQQIERLATSIPGIKTNLSATPVPKAELDSLITDKTVVLLPYLPNPSIENKLPTKLYECLAWGVPVLIADNPHWQKMLEKFGGGLAIDFGKQPDLSHISRSLNLIFKSKKSDYKELMWISEENKLIDLVNRLLL